MAKHDNIPGFPGYYVSKRGRVFSRIQILPAKGKKVILDRIQINGTNYIHI